jgi:hypothetical protein
MTDENVNKIEDSLIKITQLKDGKKFIKLE